MSECKQTNECNQGSECDKEKAEEPVMVSNSYNNIKKVIAVMSGKGGVGKSSLSALIAKELKKKHKNIGIMDADVTGPSIPRIMDVKDQKVMGSQAGIIPVQSEDGIHVMSFNLLMENEEQPVIWRGPLIANAVKQLWTDVYWGDLDYLVIDLPPGTGDVALTIMQSFPIDGVVVVSTPQDMVSMIVAKSINMAKALDIPVIGVIENMSYIECPDCKKKIKIFETGDVNDFITKMDVDLLGELPMCSEIAGLSSQKGNKYNNGIDSTLEEIAKKIMDFEKKK